ncbi:MAG: 50S ribosomal protein L23 [Rhodospirillaceae bacterium]|nr:50S ribosomal protein L23 [Rhodospirillaceae bacterium]|tara:strand:- start:284 stop:577 length:294 start_codon:yes stop_codon:yes gene_type:complete
MTTERDYDVLVGPLVTEKATMLSEHRQIAFRVRLDATKPEIRRAVERLFDVKVTGVNTLRVKGKSKIFRGRRGQRSSYKKAIVTLAEGQSVDYLSGV